MSEATMNASGTVNPAAPGIDTSKITDPIVKSGQKVYDKFAGGVQWYLEKWEDIVHEAKAERAESNRLEGVTVAGILSEIDKAPVASDIPGRVRLHVKSLRRQDHVAEQITQVVGSLPGVNQVVSNPLTGSILVLYDKGAHGSLDALMQAMKAAGA